MSKKISYRSVPIERVTSALLAALLVGATKLIVAIDVAKTKMMAGFGPDDGSPAKLVRFESPAETSAFVELALREVIEQTGRRDVRRACRIEAHMNHVAA